MTQHPSHVIIMTLGVKGYLSAGTIYNTPEELMGHIKYVETVTVIAAFPGGQLVELCCEKGLFPIKK